MPSLVKDQRKRHSQLMHKNWSYHLHLSWVKMDSNPLLLWSNPLRIIGAIAGKKLCQTLICIWENDKWKYECMKTNELSNMYILTTHFFKSPRNRFQKCLSRHSDEEDDVVCHHDLVVVLHASQGGSDLWLREAGLTALVDVIHQGLHLHWLCMSRLEHCEQRGLELLQPIGAKQQRHSYTSRICLAFGSQLQSLRATKLSFKFRRLNNSRFCQDQTTQI